MAGINIGVSLGSILLIIACFYLIKLYQKKKKQKKSSEQCTCTSKIIDKSSNQHGSEDLNDSTRQRESDV
jgi:hypothetical protein